MLIGVWVMIILFLGFPGTWEKILLLATGAALVAVGYRMPAPASRASCASDADKPFVDSKPHDANPAGPAGTVS